MNFIEAVKLATTEKKRIRRPCWNKSEYLSLQFDNKFPISPLPGVENIREYKIVVNQDNLAYVGYYCSLVADDWEVEDE